MGKISLLDCTLRDGGYLNDWRFGESAIPGIVQTLGTTGVEILEVGFLKKEIYQPDRTVFSREEQIEKIIAPKKPGMLYAGMVEVLSPLPIEELVPRSESSIDIIRVIVWKRLLKQGIDYCREIAAKGYKVCVQPARVSQYSDLEFIEMIQMLNPIKPLAVYVVDSWGTQNRETVLKYIKLADKYLDGDISLGYHGHNNMQQAFACAEAVVCAGLTRDLIIDASIFGMGRGAGNLNIELFASYLNSNFKKDYKIDPMLQVYSSNIEAVYKMTPWGYSIPYFLTALYDCNPEYASFLSQIEGLSTSQINKVLSLLSDNEKIMFAPENIVKYL